VTIIGSLRYQIAALTAARHAIVNRSFSTQVSAGGGLISQSNRFDRFNNRALHPARRNQEKKLPQRGHNMRLLEANFPAGSHTAAVAANR
jgi:hypothetical protein